MNISIDFETYCDVSVVDVGAWKYSEHPSCEILCMAWAIDDGEVNLWLPQEPFPQPIVDMLAAGAQLSAWNAQFEIAVWTNVLGNCPPIKQWRCSMAHAASCGFPLSLEKAAIATGVKNQKDAAGKRLLRKFSTPRKPTKSNPSIRTMPTDDPDDFELLLEYCRQDVRTERDIVNALPTKGLSAYEQRVWEFDHHMNARGIDIDVETVRHIDSLIEEHREATENRVMEITGGSKTSQRAAIIDWTNAQGVELGGYTVTDIKECLASDALPVAVRTVLKARQSLGKTSTSKYAKILETVCDDGTCKGLVQYHGATTGRFAGRLIQVHNLPRGNYKVDQIAPYAKDMTLEDFHLLFDDPMEAWSSLVRSMIIAPENAELFVGDFANIEGRVLAWMAEQNDLVAQFASGDDVYKHMSATIFSVPYSEVTGDQRFVGKQAVLGCGYGMGWQKFHTTCLNYGRDIGEKLALKTVHAYRIKNSSIVNAWYQVGDAASSAIKNPGMMFEFFKCKFKVERGVLLVKLPSGRILIYNAPASDVDGISYMGLDPYTKKWARISTYGGRLVENIVQGVARDILVDSMFRLQENGYEMLTTIHDENIAYRSDGLGSVAEFETVMSTPPKWAAGCPIDVEAWKGRRYKK